MTQQLTVKVSSRNQIALPSEASKELNIRSGDRLLVDVEDGVLVLVPQPQGYVSTITWFHHECQERW